VARRLAVRAAPQRFSDVFGAIAQPERLVGPGDVLEVWIWEAAPAVLFGDTPPTVMPAAGGAGTTGGPSAQSSGGTTAHATALPDQTVDDDGMIAIPFIGRVPVAGKTLEQISADIVRRLTGSAHEPEVLVRLSHSYYGSATVVGDVTTSTRLQLLPGNDRLLDALAAAAGVKTPLAKTIIQVARGDQVVAMPLRSVVRDPHQNVQLAPGDVVTALFQPYTFTVLGASGKYNDEIPFEAEGITLAQALARSGGLLDERATPHGVFVFRYEPPGALESAPGTALTTPDGRVPVVYRVDLGDPRGLFLIQAFPIQDHDVLYIANAPSVELQKFLLLLVELAYPINTGRQAGF
jgi:polysaccharide export outer membrane protein